MMITRFGLSWFESTVLDIHLDQETRDLRDTKMYRLHVERYESAAVGQVVLCHTGQSCEKVSAEEGQVEELQTGQASAGGDGASNSDAWD